MERTPLIVANWKMNFTPTQVEAFVQKFKPLVAGVLGVEIVICAPFTSLHPLSSLLAGTSIKLGAQNMSDAEEGTFTGEISAKMIAPYCNYVILGHSERRSLFNESNQDVNKKVKRALQYKLFPVVCIGEFLSERREGKTNTVLEKMFSECLAGISKNDAAKIIIAYEPIWAISRGKQDIAKSKSATPEDVQAVHYFIRSLVSQKFGKAVADEVRILYGGSMKPENVARLLSQEDIDGGLVGGASLDPVQFSKVIKFRGRLNK